MTLRAEAWTVSAPDRASSPRRGCAV